jgi:hypothetical protein
MGFEKGDRGGNAALGGGAIPRGLWGGMILGGKRWRGVKQGVAKATQEAQNGSVGQRSVGFERSAGGEESTYKGLLNTAIFFRGRVSQS